MQITSPGAGDSINWPGGFGTISVTNVDAGDPLGVGDFAGASIVWQASFDPGGLVWDEMKDGSGNTVTFDTANRVRNFSLSACKIRPFTTGTPSGSGVRAGINRRA